MLYKKEFGGEIFGIIIKPFMIFDHYNFQFFYFIIFIFINIKKSLQFYSIISSFNSTKLYFDKKITTFFMK